MLVPEPGFGSSVVPKGPSQTRKLLLVSSDDTTLATGQNLGLLKTKDSDVTEGACPPVSLQ